MNRKILLQVTGPAVIVGFLLMGACLVAAWYANRLQSQLANLPPSLESIQAAQRLETQARQLRFHSFLYLIEPDEKLLKEVEQDEKQFEAWLVKAEQVAFTEGEQRAVTQIEEGYARYKQDLEVLRDQVEKLGPRRDVRKVWETHPLRHILEPCGEYARINEELITKTWRENERVSQWLHLAMLILGVGGPLGGLLSGYGIARGLSRSLHRLSVRVQDMAQHLEKEVATVKLVPDGDLHHLDRQLDHVMDRVAEVTSRVQQQQREILRAQQLAAVGQLASSVAHEVRNPLTSIKMLVEAGLRTHRPKPFTEENLKVVHGEIIRLEHTVQSLLDFARPPVLARSLCTVQDIVHQAVGLVGARASQQKVVIDVRCPEEPVRAVLDVRQFCNVLVNLLLNALDAMPTGGRVSVDLETRSSDGLRLHIGDTGEGIAPSVLNQLFVPFVSTKPTGSGLGLSICKQIIEDHDGTVTAANRAEGGARFTILLPNSAKERNHEFASHH